MCANKIISIQNSEKKEKRINDFLGKSFKEQMEFIKPSFERFFDKVDGCWVWKGAKKSLKKLQYGCFSYIGNKTQCAHRVSWMIYNGEIPKGLLVLHKCDNASCVNPSHLWLGTHHENNRDKLSKNRSTQNKLTVEKVKEIKQMILDGISDTKIAKLFNITRHTIWHIKIKRTWSDICI